MADLNDSIAERFARLERTNRMLVGLISTTFVVMCSALLVGFSHQCLRRNPCGEGA